jgi:hypothetical protein
MTKGPFRFRLLRLSGEHDVVITAPAEGTIIPIHESIQVMATVGDPGSADTHACTVSFGDGCVPPTVLLVA